MGAAGRVVPWLVVAASLGVACSAGPTDQGAAAASSPPPVATPSMQEPSPDVAPQPAEPREWGLPDTMAGQQLAWFLGVLEGRDVLTEDLYEVRFAAVFRDAVPHLQLTGTAIGVAGHYELLRVETDQEGTLVAVMRSATSTVRFTIHVEAEGDHLIDGLFVGLAPDDPITIETYDDVSPALARAASDHTWLVADVSDGSCVEVAGHDVDRSLPLGSIFKLYVLGALDDAVTAGTVSWDDEVEVRADLVSLPPSVMADLDPGETMTVREAAGHMIEISDNTATDHLLALLGRSAVETALAAMGHGDPAVNVPMLSTREMTLLKFTGDDERRDRFLAADADGRRAILDDELAGTPVRLIDLVGLDGTPRDVFTIEWFASPLEVCHALVDLAGRGPEVREILAANVGLPGLDVAADYAGFKGGSEPGVLAGAWYVEHGGQTHVVVLQLADADEEVAGWAMLDIAAPLMELVLDVG